MKETIINDRVKILEGRLYVDNTVFADNIINACEIDGYRIPETMIEIKWLKFDRIFNNTKNNKNVDEAINVVVESIFNLREQKKDVCAIDLSDRFFESFTPLMSIILHGGNNFHQASNMWKHIIVKIKYLESIHGVEFGQGVHKGTAFYFLGFTTLMMGDVSGAYSCFAEAAKEDEVLPEIVLSRHSKKLPPVVKILLLDSSQDNFAYDLVKQIRETIIKWERNNPQISRGTPIFTSMEKAIEKGVIPRESAIHLCYAFSNAVFINLWKENLIRPTYLNISQLGESILRFARTLEDFTKLSRSSSNDKKWFDYCHDKWFPSENWHVKNYNKIGIGALMKDYNEWNLSKDGKHLLFTIKIRNILAHQIPNDVSLYDDYIKIVLIIACSFGFVCDKISE